MGQETSTETIRRYLSDHCSFLDARRDERLGCVELYRDNYTKSLLLKKQLRFASQAELESLRCFLHLTEKGHKNLASVVMASEDLAADGVAGSLLCEHHDADLESLIHSDCSRGAGVDPPDQAARP